MALNRKCRVPAGWVVQLFRQPPITALSRDRQFVFASNVQKSPVLGGRCLSKSQD